MTDVVGFGTSGSVGNAALIAPYSEVSASGTLQNYGSAVLTMPAGVLAPTGRAALYITYPSIAASGSSVAPVSYATYILNLNHPDSAVGAAAKKDELTVHSNMAFVDVVRFKDDYYGVSANGLFKLGGTTDFADPAPEEITWSFKTCMTDFGVEQLQTVDSVFFGGRLGPEATVTLYFGDEGAESYSYSTPADSSAQNYRQLFGRGIRARYFALGVSGRGPMALDSIVFSVTTLSRTI